MTTHIYVDVDGVLNSLSRDPGVDNTSWPLDGWSDFVANGYTIRFHKGVIEELKVLEALPDIKIFWLTTWTTDAPALLSPTLGIGADWEVIGDDVEQNYGSSYLNWWKFHALSNHLSETDPDRVVWIDDDLLYYDARVNPEKILKVAPISVRGLESSHFERIKEFLEA